MSFRPHLARNLAECLTLLGPLSKDSDAYVRRFAIEVTRPRSVWGTHIVALRAVSDQTEAPRHCERSEAIEAATAAYDHWIASSLRSSQRRFSVVENRSKKEPQRALALLENTRADPARYVQLGLGTGSTMHQKSRPTGLSRLRRAGAAKEIGIQVSSSGGECVQSYARKRNKKRLTNYCCQCAPHGRRKGNAKSDRLGKLSSSHGRDQ